MEVIRCIKQGTSRFRIKIIIFTHDRHCSLDVDLIFDAGNVIINYDGHIIYNPPPSPLLFRLQIQEDVEFAEVDGDLPQCSSKVKLLASELDTTKQSWTTAKEEATDLKNGRY